MEELQVAIKDLLATDATLAPILNYFVAPLNSHLPYVEYWTGNGMQDDWAGFHEEARRCDIFVQASSRDGLEAIRLYELAETKLQYARVDVSGWQQRGKVEWQHELDDPGDATQDDELIYYAGGVFQIRLFRQRTD